MAFGSKKICPVCGQPLKGLFHLKIKDNVAICSECASQVDMDNNMISYQSPEDIKSHLEYRRENKEEFSTFNTTSEIKTDSMYFRADLKKKLWYYSNEKKPANPPLIKFGEIVEYELTEDGETITKGGLGRAVAGGLLFGAAGAVVGGVTGKRKSKQEISSISVRITLSNPYHAGVTVEMIPAGAKYKSGSILYNAAKQKSNDLMSFLGNLKAQAEQATEVPANNQSAADEIMKYKNLLDVGAITPDEYEAKKKELLGI